MTQVTWIGDEDPSAQVITQNGVTFVKGEAVTVSAEIATKLKDNPLFSTKKDADPVKAIEPDPVEADAGSEKAELRERLRGLGITVSGNPSLETLRGKLADALK